MNHWTLIFSVAFLPLVACGGGEAPPPEPEPTMDEEPEDEAALSEDVQKAVDVAKAIDKDPASADKALEDAGLSAEEFDALMYDIASDPAKTAAYLEARGG